MSKAPRSLPGQEPIPIAERAPAQAPEVQAPAGLDQQQTDEFDRLDAQGMRNAVGVRAEIKAAALTEEPAEFIEFEEGGVPVAIHRDIAFGLKSGEEAKSTSYKPRSRRKLSGRQRLLADGPVVPQPPYN